jgi:peptide/nickel transport system substrate-binding protein
MLGLMVARKQGLAAALALVFVSGAAACQQAVSPRPLPADAGPSASRTVPRQSQPADNEPDLFGTAYVPEEGRAGGQILIGDANEANTFNPFYVGVVSEANVASAVWATLVVVTHDYKYAPDLAVEIPTLDNGGVAVPGLAGDAMTVTWKLKPGLRWSDGEPLTCQDFRYSWEWVLHPANAGVVTTGWDDISDWQCVSDSEMVLHFKAIYEGYLGLVAAPLPRHYLESIPLGDQVTGAGFRPEELARVPTSGAFAYQSITPGQELRLVRNEHYRSFARSGPAYLETIVFKWYGDVVAMIAGYRAGDIDLAFELSDSDVPSVQDLGDEVSAIPALTYEFLRPNWADGTRAGEDGVGGCSRNPVVQHRGEGCPMADPAMRRALAYAIDKEQITARLLGGRVQVANTPITPDAWFYADQPPTSYDPDRARSILEGAGWTDADGDGVREKNGLRATIELCTNARQRRVDTLALVAAWLADVGVEAIPNPVDVNLIFAGYHESTPETPCALSRSNFDLALHHFSSSIDPLGNYFSYHSSQFQPVGANEAQVKDTQIDAALDAVRNSVDFEVVRDAMADFQRAYVEQTVEIPLFYHSTVELVSPVLGNFMGNPTQAGPTWNAADWYLKP